MSEGMTISSQLARAVQDSRLLLTHAAHAGLELDGAMLETLVQAQYRTNAEDWSNDDEAAFWQAFSHLNALVKPVTLESLKALSSNRHPIPGIGVLRVMNKAYRTAGTYAFVATLFMVLLLVVQMYWLMGEKLSQHFTDLTSRIQQFEQHSELSKGPFTQEYDALRMEIETTRETLFFWSRPWSFALSAVEEEFAQPYDDQEELRLEIADIREQLKNAANRLTAFKDFQFDAAGQELNAVYRARVDELTDTLIRHQTAYEQAENENQFLETELRTQYVLHVLQRYFLPLFYGLLGASAYVLRSLILAIQRETYTARANAKYRMRLFSGALAGLLIGFFIIPKETSGLATLPPMALSFLAGYNVEVLFLAMDQFIEAVIKRIQRRVTGNAQ